MAHPRNHNFAPADTRAPWNLREVDKWNGTSCMYDYCGLCKCWWDDNHSRSKHHLRNHKWALDMPWVGDGGVEVGQVPHELEGIEAAMPAIDDQVGQAAAAAAPPPQERAPPPPPAPPGMEAETVLGI